MQTKKACYITGAEVNLHRHHIYAGNPNRKLSEKYGCWVWLRADWHNMSNYGVHFNRQLDLRLKQEAQRKFEAIHGHEKFMKVFAKNYL